MMAFAFLALAIFEFCMMLVMLGLMLWFRRQYRDRGAWRHDDADNHLLLEEWTIDLDDQAQLQAYKELVEAQNRRAFQRYGLDEGT